MHVAVLLQPYVVLLLAVMVCVVQLLCVLLLMPYGLLHVMHHCVDRESCDMLFSVGTKGVMWQQQLHAYAQYE